MAKAEIKNIRISKSVHYLAKVSANSQGISLKKYTEDLFLKDAEDKKTIKDLKELIDGTNV